MWSFAMVCVNLYQVPEGHVPSFKDFKIMEGSFLSSIAAIFASLVPRKLLVGFLNKLANIVRRRGCTIIGYLLSNSTESDTDETPNMEKNLVEGLDAISHSAGRAKDLNSDDNTSMAVETSANLYLEEMVKYDSSLVYENYGCMSTYSSLEEKVAEFIRNGKSDAIEGNVYGLSHGSGSGESKGIREPENMTEFHSKILTDGNFENAFGESDTASILNGSLSTLMQVVPSLTVSHTVRNESPDESLASADITCINHVELINCTSHNKIKFIVDGHWRFDPQMESLTKGGIFSNILRRSISPRAHLEWRFPPLLVFSARRGIFPFFRIFVNGVVACLCDSKIQRRAHGDHEQRVLQCKVVSKAPPFLPIATFTPLLSFPTSLHPLHLSSPALFLPPRTSSTSVKRHSRVALNSHSLHKNALILNASFSSLLLKNSSPLLPSSSFPNTSAPFFRVPTHDPSQYTLSGSTRKIRCFYSCFEKKREFIEAVDESEEVELMDKPKMTLLYSFIPLPLLFTAALPGAATVRSLFGPFVELVKQLNLPDWLVHWGHPGNMAVVLFAMGGYGTYLGFRIRFSDDVEEKAKAKDLHPKLLGGMFFFFALGATGGITSLLTSDKTIFESPHAVTGVIGLALLTIQTILPALFEGNPGLRNIHGILGSGIMTLFLFHAVLGLQLGLSY
ncbi:PREDICTED: uncharacterized protein LOC105112586 [Populus euphratica]|uniref:Uncharacterized protein LOC105112586 n=1 Tax=Populus euphratica TaxID=75702 RepID=A0AAJ6T8F6_POPEU|nr:PREDICTED: uncharacterized protein LOC105112586 [Populus euphratica]